MIKKKNGSTGKLLQKVVATYFLTNKEAEAMYDTVIKHDGLLRTRGKM